MKKLYIEVDGTYDVMERACIVFSTEQIASKVIYDSDARVIPLFGSSDKSVTEFAKEMGWQYDPISGKKFE